MKVGVLALQGAVREHIWSLERSGADAVPVRVREEIDQVHALILPGGESTTVGKHLVRLGLDVYLRERILSGMPVFGTCTGLILLARDIIGSDQPRIGVMDINVARNSFGRQVDSSEAQVEIPALGDEPYHAVFIRAPHIQSVGHSVEVLSRYDGRIVMARQGHMLAAAFHPELTDDDRIHRYFLNKVCSSVR